MVRRKKKRALVILKDGTVNLWKGIGRTFQEIQQADNHPTERDQGTKSIGETNIFSVEGAETNFGDKLGFPVDRHSTKSSDVSKS